MNKISRTGAGLSVLIICDYLPHHSWMTFASWYSFYQMLPDAKIALSCNRTGVTGQMFDWTRTLKIPMRLYTAKTKQEHLELALQTKLITLPVLVVEADVLMIRDLSESFFEHCENLSNISSDKMSLVSELHKTATPMELCHDVKSESLVTFISYSMGWGNFVASRWINKSSSPFRYRFGKPDMTSNEVRVEKLWQQLASLSQIVSRGN